MTLEEKVGQMNQAGPRYKRDLDADIREGRVGTLLSFRDVRKINHFQRIAVEESRLHIPLIVGNDVIHGYRTIFPIPLAESCTWDPILVEHAARVAADEAAASGTDWIFAPMVDVARDPRWGRIAEGPGEDPVLGAELARARVRGFQTKGLAGDKRVAACPKHYAAYGVAEAGKDYNTVDISERTLRDVYLPPFKAAFDEGAVTVMSSFNEIAGVPSSANAFLLRTVLRDEWAWPGVVLSDYDAIGELIQHGLAEDLREAALKAILAGEDIDMMSYAFPDHLAALVREGLVPEALVDGAVLRILKLKMALGIFDRPYCDEGLESQVLLRPEHRELALEVAQKSIVLLKNERQTLPVGPQVRRLALIGPLADNQAELLGCWACQGRAEEVESVRAGFRAALAEQGREIEIFYAQGCAIEGDGAPDIDGAVAAARQADIAILVLGESAMMSGEAHSRAHLGLPGHQQALLEAVVAACEPDGIPVAVVLMSGRPLAIPWMAEHVPAIVAAWHGGIRAGRAIADVLLGAVNPSGKLTACFPRAEGQIPVYHATKSTGRPVNERGVIQFNRAHKVMFLDLPHTPQFGFGHGLSYTTFAYSDLKVETPKVPVDGTLVVTAIVANTGDRAGDEIVQLYVQDLVGSVTRPVKELKEFQKITLQPGEGCEIMFEVAAQALGFHGPDMRYVVEPGEFKVWIGPNAAEGLEGQFRIVSS
ncbi:MAG: glycoside hydrolase family 3 C-terminal domain-containing protein [Anaerolineae bacterium]|nr:glycoside hydrolase family 3 C-terminal domain-containing protein [Anaerolineae bacterium]